jgi:hypothetical protein
MNYHQQDMKTRKVNIGDYIQSIAAEQFLPKVDTHIDRDELSYYDGEPVKMIMNGWWHFNKGNELPSSKITPLWTSCHISNQKDV